ncbi:MAG: hypothetical protein M3Y75_01730, partial [Actinomycetota bacterium]|nr:hypothetical protein [Actinomycetota bacterium]
MKHTRVIINALALLLLTAAFPLSALAQGNSNTNPGDPYLVCENCWADPDPTPAQRRQASPAPTPAPTDEKGLKVSFVYLTDHARELVPKMRRLVEKPLLGTIQRIAWVLASIILVFSFMRVLKENNGASDDFYYWIARGTLWMQLLIVGPFVVSMFLIVGNLLTIPLDGISGDLQHTFDEKYREFMEGHFIIKDSKAVFVPPMEDGSPGLLGILYDKETKITDIDKIGNALDVSSWSMPKLFALLGFCRGALEFFDFFLIIGGGFILIGLRLGSPIAIAMGIDQKMAHQMTYPYAWGTAAYTLVFPVFREGLRIVAYTVANFGLAVYDGRPMYWMDERTGAIITGGGYEPTITIFIAAFMMLVAALSMPMATVMAYRFVRGQNFEGISSVTGGWMASIVGTGVEAYGLRAGAAIQKQAENTQIQGGYQSESTRAQGSLDAANLGARARQIAGTANIQGGLIAALANIRGNQVTQTMIASASAQFGKDQTRAGVSLSQRDIEIRRGQAVGDTDIGMRRELQTGAGHTSAEKSQTLGSSLGPLGLYWSYKGITKRNVTDREASNTFSGQTISLENQTAGRLTQSQTQYEGDMGIAFDRQLGATVAGVNAGAGIASGGASRGAQVSVGGINQAYTLEMKGNQTVYNSTVEAATISRDAGLEAANLR